MKKVISHLTLALSLVLLSTGAYANSEENKEPQDQQQGKHRGPPPFAKLDLNADGSITLEEFSQHKIPRASHEEIFSRIDANGDGLIVEEELRKHKPPRRDDK